jgi:outer membrane protein TolC
LFSGLNTPEVANSLQTPIWLWPQACTAGSLRIPVILLLMSSAVPAQISITAPPEQRLIGPVLRPFHIQRRIVSPARLSDTPRLESLVKSGNLYLTVNDVAALVLENNLDIEIQRYGPFIAREVQRRAEAGGFLRNASTPLLAGPVSVSTAGVSTNTGGLAGGAGLSSGGGIVSQIGPVPPNLDPNLYAGFSLGHSTTPLTNTLLSQTTALTNDYRQLALQYSQSFLTGTYVQLTYVSYRSFENSPSLLLNPSTSGYADFYIQQPLLQGLSRAVNGRDIKVAQNNLKVTSLQLQRQVSTTVSAALNLYWDLVTFLDNVRIGEQALAAAEKLYEDNRNQAKIGSLAAIQVTAAAAAVSAAKEELLIAQTNVAQQETILKNTLSRTGSSAAWLDDIHILPLDHIEIPKTDDIRPAAELISTALADRPDIAQSRLNVDSSRIFLKGSKNNLLPSLNAFADLENSGLAGPANPTFNGSGGSAPDPYFVGGYGNFVSQIFRRNFPNYSAGFSLNIPFRNRAAQADYVTDELQLRQSELQLQRLVNQVGVEVKNAVIGLRQARTRYETAVNTRTLGQQNLEAQQDMFKYGAVADATLVIQAQKDLVADETAEIQAMANYTHARIAFDEATGQTLAVNHISMQEAATGQVLRHSVIPEQVGK